MPTTTNNPRIITKEAEYRDYYNIAAIVSSQISLVSVALYRLNRHYNIDLIQPCFGPWGVIAFRKSEISLHSDLRQGAHFQLHHVSSNFQASMGKAA
jgi:hypothetical protein